jgi:single-strand DNA-binding protein
MPYPSPANCATLIGRLTRDPELRTVVTSTGERSVLTLGLAVRRPVRAEGEDAPSADFFDVSVWGLEAERCARYLRKGRLAAVSARLQPGTVEGAQGERRRTLELIGTAVEFLDRAPRDEDGAETAPAQAPSASEPAPA